MDGDTMSDYWIWKVISQKQDMFRILQSDYGRVMWARSQNYTESDKDENCGDTSKGQRAMFTLHSKFCEYKLNII